MNIIELAKQAGFFEGKTGTLACDKDELERFAALVRAEERERCAAKCDELANMPTGSADPRSARMIDTAYMTAAAAIRGMGDE